MIAVGRPAVRARRSRGEWRVASGELRVRLSVRAQKPPLLGGRGGFVDDAVAFDGRSSTSGDLSRQGTGMAAGGEDKGGDALQVGVGDRVQGLAQTGGIHAELGASSQ